MRCERIAVYGVSDANRKVAMITKGESGCLQQ
jgi:hypothetical protein